MARRVTLQTIADRVGVSRMTVSNAFSRPDQLSAPLRRRILTAAQDLGYVGPDPAARALSTGTTGAVGIVFTSDLRAAFTDVVATMFLGAIADELAPTGLALTLLTSFDNGEIIPARDVAMDGALVYSCDPTAPALDYLKRRKLPLVYIDQQPADPVSCINVDDRSGARAAAQHLLDLGHRRIGLLMTGLHGPHGVIDPDTITIDGYAAKQRLLGWRDALQTAGVEPIVVRQPTTGMGETRIGARLLLDRPDRPTAVLCFSDALAHMVIEVADDLGIHVPAELSVVGFDDNPLAERLRPPLTTVHQDIGAKGRAAAAALTSAILAARSDTAHKPLHLVFPADLIVRASTAAAPA